MPGERAWFDPLEKGNYNVYPMATKARIVHIGNSRGIRIPKSLLEQSELPEEVEIRSEPGRLVVTAAHETRAGWSKAAEEMRAAGSDRLLEQTTETRFDHDEWEW